MRTFPAPKRTLLGKAPAPQKRWAGALGSLEKLRPKAGPDWAADQQESERAFQATKAKVRSQCAADHSGKFLKSASAVVSVPHSHAAWEAGVSFPSRPHSALGVSSGLGQSTATEWLVGI